MIKVSAKVTGLDKIGPAIAAHMKRTLPLETRRQILLQEAQPVAEMMKAKAPRSTPASRGDRGRSMRRIPHAAHFIGAKILTPEDTAEPLAGTRNERVAQAIQRAYAASQLAASGAAPAEPEATVAIGVMDVPGGHDRGFVFRFIEYGTKKMAARPFLRPIAAAELPAMLARVRERVTKALQS